MILQAATSEDAEELTRIAHAAIASSCLSPSQVEVWTTAFTVERMASAIDEDTVLMVVQGVRILGFASLRLHGDTAGEIDLWYVDPEFSRRGVGRLVVRGVEDAARSREMDQLWVDASPAARHRLSSLGYRVHDSHVKHLGDVRFDNTWMKKLLC